MAQLRVLDLENAGRHRKLHWEFPPGLIGIFGPNGSGKSTAMNLAYGCTTGDFGKDRLPGGPRRQLAEPFEDSFVRTQWQHNARMVTIERNFTAKGKTTHLCQVEGEDKVYTMAGDVEKRLEDFFGAKLSTFDRNVFIPQWDLFAFISALDSERAKALGQLCQTDISELIHADLKGAIDRDSSTAATVLLESSDDLNIAIGALRSSSRALAKEIEAIVMPDPELVKKWQAGDTKTERRTALMTSLKAKHQRLKDLQTELATTETRLTAKEAELATATTKLEATRQAAADAAAAIKTYDADLAQWQAKGTAEQAVSKMESGAVAQPTGKTVEQINDQINKLTEEAALPRQIVAQFEAKFDDVTTTKCPLCGAELHDAQEHLADAKKKLEDLEPKLTEARTALGARRAADSVYQRYSSELRSAKERLERYVKVTEPATINRLSLQDKITAHSAAKIKHTSLTSEVQNLRDSKTRLSANVLSLTEQNQAIVTEVKGLDVALLELGDYAAALAAYQLQQTALAEKNASKRMQDSDIEKKTKELERIRTIEKRTTDAKAWVARATAMRKVFHRDELPHKVHLAVMQMMEEQITAKMETFNSPFTLRANEKLGFEAVFPDGTVMTDRGLSGGEKMITAPAYHSVKKSMFSSQIDTLVLDEPTAGVDDDNLECLAHYLTQLSGEMASEGGQIIMITHELSLAPIFDYTLGLNKNVTTQ